MQAGFSGEPVGTICGETVRGWFEDPIAVQHYARAAASLGLWRSEERVFTAVFRPGHRILDVGCGAGRIALSLAARGFERLTGLDFCRPMIALAREMATDRGVTVAFVEGDALALPFEAAAFDGAIFGFNGLMQIPGRDNRRQALGELARIVAVDGALVFTTHDRDVGVERARWAAERERWDQGLRAVGTLEFGDRIIHGAEGRIFMHLPDRVEILEDLAASGWNHIEDHMRASLANEPAAVREFSDECRFWIATRRG